MGLWDYGANLRPVVQAVNSFTGSWEAGLSTRESDSSVVAAGTLSSIIDPDRNSLGSVLSVVPRETMRAGVGPCCSQFITSVWCLFPPLCTPALSVSPGLPLPTALTAVGAGLTPEMSEPQRQGSVPTQSSSDSVIFCPICRCSILKNHLVVHGRDPGKVANFPVRNQAICCQVCGGTQGW